MGFYVNPLEGSKEEWLEVNGTRIANPIWPPPAEEAYVCLVDNRPTLPFTAALVCYCLEEFMVAFHPSDNRPKTWYLVPCELVESVSPIMPEYWSTT